jgi:hypothetical protein
MPSGGGGNFGGPTTNNNFGGGVPFGGGGNFGGPTTNSNFGGGMPSGMGGNLGGPMTNNNFGGGMNPIAQFNNQTSAASLPYLQSALQSLSNLQGFHQGVNVAANAMGSIFPFSFPGGR